MCLFSLRKNFPVDFESGICSNSFICKWIPGAKLREVGGSRRRFQAVLQRGVMTLTLCKWPPPIPSFLRAQCTHGEIKQTRSRGLDGETKGGNGPTVTYGLPLCTRRHVRGSTAAGSDPFRGRSAETHGLFSWYPSPYFETTRICVGFQHDVILITQSAELTCIVVGSGWYGL